MDAHPSGTPGLFLSHTRIAPALRQHETRVHSARLSRWRFGGQAKRAYDSNAAPSPGGLAQQQGAGTQDPPKR